MLRAQQPVGRGLSGRHGGTEAVPWGSPSLHVVPESRNVCWQGVLGTRLTPLRVAAYQVQPSTLRLPLTWPSEGPSPLLRGTPWVPCAGSILGLSGPGKPPVESGVNEADSPKAKRRLVRGRLVGAWRAAGLRGPGTGKPQCMGRFLQGHPAGSLASELQYQDLWGTSPSALTSQTRSCPRAHSGTARPGQRPSDAQTRRQQKLGCRWDQPRPPGEGEGDTTLHAEWRFWKSTNSAQACPCLGAPATQAPIPSAEKGRVGEREGF